MHHSQTCQNQTMYYQLLTVAIKSLFPKNLCTQDLPHGPRNMQSYTNAFAQGKDATGIITVICLTKENIKIKKKTRGRYKQRQNYQTLEANVKKEL